MIVSKPTALFLLLLIELQFQHGYYGQNSHTDDAHNSFFTGIIKFSAHITIPLAEIIASDAAAIELNKFRTGEHDGLPILYTPTDQATKELLQGAYYQELTQYLIAAMNRWYGGKIPTDGGLYTHSDTFRVFAGHDAFLEMINGIDVADIIGSFTYYIRLTTSSGKINFHAVNVMSLSSYAGERYFQHDMVTDPDRGAFKSRVQIFQWQTDIPVISDDK